MATTKPLAERLQEAAEAQTALQIERLDALQALADGPELAAVLAAATALYVPSEGVATGTGNALAQQIVAVLSNLDQNVAGARLRLERAANPSPPVQAAPL